MKYLVAYDIRKNSTRNKVSRLLTKYGYRIQLSVFYLPNVSKAELDYLYLQIKRLVNAKTDRVFFYPVEAIEEFHGYPLEPWQIGVF